VSLYSPNKATTDLIRNVSTTLEEVDQFVGRTQNILYQTINENMSEEDGRSPLIDVASAEKNLPDAPQSISEDNSLGSDTISLEAALRLLPNSFNGENQEEMEIFLEKCEFALSCTSRQVQTRLLQGISVRLTGKARQAIKFRTFDTWAALRDTLKSA
jgi:hypothetical protein